MLTRLGHGITPVLAVLPIGLVAGDGLVRVIGVSYLVVYFGLIVPVVSASAWLVIDGVLMVLGKYPIVLPRVLASVEGDERGQITGRSRRVTFVHGLAQAQLWINPMIGPAMVMLATAMRTHPELVKEVFDRAEPTIEFTLSVVERVVRDSHLVGA